MYEDEFPPQKVVLEETEGVVSVRSLEALLQWLYLRVVKFDIIDPTEHVSAAIELARLADKYNIEGLEIGMAQYIKDILIANPPPTICGWEPANINDYWLSTDHIKSATLLPREHPVRKTLAAASVRAYLQIEKPKLAEETQDYPSFGADLLQELKLTLNGLRYTTAVLFKDPLTGKDLELR
ncbi:hypothetical protein N7523_007118 [Penicillium sp. IBT 18751x]|nr:hypothetical protein N7523_007118 [Penicillium sp. IBT 18751x]